MTKAQSIKPIRSLLGLLETHFSAPFFAILLLGAIWFGTSLLIASERINLEQETIKSTLALGDIYEAQMIRNLSFIDQTLKTIKYAYERDPKPTTLSKLGDKGLLPPRLVFAISITDKTGNIIASNTSKKLARFTKYNSLSKHYSGTSFMHVDFVGYGGNSGVIQFSRYFKLNDGTFAGIVMVSVAPSYFMSGYDNDRLGKHGLLSLVGSDGIFVAKRTGNQEEVGGQATSVMEMASEKNTRDRSVLMVHPWDGVERYTNIRQLYGFPLTIVLGLSKAEKLVTFHQKRNQYLWIAGIASVLLVMVTVLLARLSLELARSHRRIRKKQQTYYVASEASLDAMFVLRCDMGLNDEIRDFILENVNNRGGEMLGVAKGEIINGRLTHMFPGCRTNGVFDDLVKVFKTGELSETEWKNDIIGLRDKWLYRQVVRVEDGVVVIVRDISERKKEEARMTHMALHDVLTGLPNRALLHDRINEAIVHAQANQRMIAVLFMDLDGFKQVNDSHGHKIGDELLKIISKRMVNCLRQTDTVARMGGDEFVIVLSGQSNMEDILIPTLERIRSVVTEPVHVESLTLRVTLSIGVTVYPEHGEDSETLLSRADMAMYEAKSHGRNNYQFYGSEDEVYRPSPFPVNY